MNERLKSTRRLFVATITLFAAMSVLLLGFALYEANLISFNDDIKSAELQAAVAEHPEVQEYLETEHQNEAHFITIANIIKNDQQQELGRTMIWVIIAVLILAIGLGYVLAKRLLRPVRQAYEAQERFLADAAHELRNPLATMSAVVQNATSSNATTKKQFDKYLQQIKRQLKRMVRINEDLLFLERDIDEENDGNTNLSELLKDVVEDMQPHATDRKLSFKLDIEADLESDIAARDFVRLSRNLIENAIKYSRPKSRTVSISLKSHKNKAELLVKDSGIGIPAEDIEKIKDRFYRGSNASDVAGSGLGMSIVQKIVDKRKGEFEITSQLNKGTTVRITL